MLKQIVDKGWFKAAACVRLLAGERLGRRHCRVRRCVAGQPIATLHTLRQQLARREGRANVALADFVAPKRRLPIISAPSS